MNDQTQTPSDVVKQVPPAGQEDAAAQAEQAEPANAPDRAGGPAGSQAEAAPSPGPLPDSSTAILKLARQATARIVTAALEATAESADMERAALARKFPAMTSLPAPLRLDPQQIRDFTRSGDYQQLVEQYIQGRIEGHLLARVLDLLGQYLPLLFAR